VKMRGSVEWGPYMNKTMSCPSFSFVGNDMENCAAPCSSNFILLHVFFVSTPLDSENWTAELTLSWIWSLVPTLLVFFPALFGLFGSRKRIPLTPLFAAAFVGGCSVWNLVISKFVGLADTRIKYRPGWDPHTQEQYTQLYGGFGKSCVGEPHGYGFPSGHSSNAMGAFTWYVLELWRGYGVDTKMSFWGRMAWTVVAAVLCVPVMPARVGVYDHTWLQVVVGGLQGVFLGVVFYYTMRCSIGPRLPAFCVWVNDSKCCPFGSVLCFGRPLVDTYWSSASDGKDSEGGDDVNAAAIVTTSGGNNAYDIELGKPVSLVVKSP